MFVDAPAQVAAKLLDWYDVHARALPWRAPPGTARTEPYRVWLSEIMLQQTTVAAVRGYFAKFTERWPTVDTLANADDADVMAAWAGLGYYARARNLIACARAVARDHGGSFPDSEAGLRTLPGIGDYSAAAIAAIAFGRRAVVIDANVERVTSRLFAFADPLPAARPRLRALVDTITPNDRAGDFAQAMMDLGSGICTPRNPQCLICPLRDPCKARVAGNPETYPVKAAKKPKPQRKGTAFWIEHEGDVLLVRRPDKGMLGGMRALPTGPWSDEDPALTDAPVDADWREAGSVTHVFTHFALDLRVVVTKLSARPDISGEWWPIPSVDTAGLPTLFARAAARAIAGSK
ncbi:A/G-specific adenine glycosylase [Sphingomonas montanisoli]|uniref:Adenine DNA glycosylase n=1 Tax=Sphingomonas montanisoli TaxID=2606412 RepID=A0A5D9BZ20_9SPHN|nr:A/G-specific adenine glycosylase [Sphingomonas montanisoli]TZG24636.1 A/G-specific adenine glycosylase [Sphingomonas montanisoli]